MDPLPSAVQKRLNRSRCPWCMDCGGSSKEACVRRLEVSTHWRNLANTIEPSVCGGDAALCQIALTTCFSRCIIRERHIQWLVDAFAQHVLTLHARFSFAVSQFSTGHRRSIQLSVFGRRRSPSGGAVDRNTRPSLVVPATTSRRLHDTVLATTVAEQRRNDPVLRQRAQACLLYTSDAADE